MKPEDILKKWNITKETKHHSYSYLYKSMIEIIDCLNNQIQAEKQTAKIEIEWRDKMIEENFMKEEGVSFLKLKLIDAIASKHPSHGVTKGWSTYTGGFVDDGQWFIRKMIDIPYDELKKFYQTIEDEE